MRNKQFKAIGCEISRGGFWDERVFQFKIEGCDYSGVTTRRYFWTSAGEPIPEDEPPIGEKMQGFVAAYVIEVRHDGALVSVPDGQVLVVPMEALVDRPYGS